MITGVGDKMGGIKHISEMLEMSDADANEVINDVAVSVSNHHLMSEVVRDLVAKYDKQVVLAGMMLAKTFEQNEHETTMCKYAYGWG